MIEATERDGLIGKESTICPASGKQRQTHRHRGCVHGRTLPQHPTRRGSACRSRQKRVILRQTIR
jgi:hypothetical protein